ncbi:uncharacterized protein MONBRDRAFT_4916 [Monosiga brevicollis MX1]|uniref:Uncharacterized protein n=1 Tax=Monosiga brevicollis TaxID=81824 RepID=A9UPC1_MONBE|nr:uncharacterized protein MONBRDRAFT_4916 [Monosiga brevicollis MX1]EDQ92851.1 predicted protein [Monosiga brevicollis MX1]|eukprot:XP_001742613.1 hypothetical protein [Monosiga brevicollis MX1]
MAAKARVSDWEPSAIAAVANINTNAVPTLDQPLDSANSLSCSEDSSLPSPAIPTLTLDLTATHPTAKMVSRPFPVLKMTTSGTSSASSSTASRSPTSSARPSLVAMRRGKRHLPKLNLASISNAMGSGDEDNLSPDFIGDSDRVISRTRSASAPLPYEYSLASGPFSPESLPSPSCPTSPHNFESITCLDARHTLMHSEALRSTEDLQEEEDLREVNWTQTSLDLMFDTAVEHGSDVAANLFDPALNPVQQGSVLNSLV